ncbi:MAG: hypothetical protein DRJ64_02825 [Thermoprotei archaeon]|nr:MAG: hypothetical protein DRJ64_02825 [Thermoprotei archaeon]
MQDKLEAMKKLKKALEEGKVDGDIIDLLLLINSIKGVHTTSSCSGRVGIMETPEFGAKPLSRWLIKKHEPISLSEVKEALEDSKEGILIFKVQPPIFHIVCENLEIAKRVHQLGLESGFKYTSFRALSYSGRILVEINSTENISAPIGKDGKILVDDSFLEFLVEMGNRVLLRGKAKIDRLKESFYKLKEVLGNDPNWSVYELS